MLLTLVVAAPISGSHALHPIGQWATERSDDLVPPLGVTAERLPSTATLRRALRMVDVAGLEERIDLPQLIPTLTLPPKRQTPD